MIKRSLVLLVIFVLLSHVAFAGDFDAKDLTTWTPENVKSNFDAAVGRDPARAFTVLGDSINTDPQVKAKAVDFLSKADKSTMEHLGDIPVKFFSNPENLKGTAGSRFLAFYAKNDPDSSDVKFNLGDTMNYVKFDPDKGVLVNGNNQPVVSLKELGAGTTVTPLDKDKGFKICVSGHSGDCGVDVTPSRTASTNTIIKTTDNAIRLYTSEGKSLVLFDDTISKIDLSKALNAESYTLTVNAQGKDVVISNIKPDSPSWSSIYVTERDGNTEIALSGGQHATIPVDFYKSETKFSKYDGIDVKSGTVYLTVKRDNYEVLGKTFGSDIGEFKVYSNTQYGTLETGTPENINGVSYTKAMQDAENNKAKKIALESASPSVWVRTEVNTAPSKDQYDRLRAGVFVADENSNDKVIFSGTAEAKITPVKTDSTTIDAGRIRYSGQPYFAESFSADSSGQPNFDVVKTPTQQEAVSYFAGGLEQYAQDINDKKKGLEDYVYNKKEQLTDPSLTPTLKAGYERVIQEKQDALDDVNKQIDNLPKKDSNQKYDFAEVQNFMSSAGAQKGPVTSIVKDNNVVSFEAVPDLSRKSVSTTQRYYDDSGAPEDLPQPQSQEVPTKLVVTKNVFLNKDSKEPAPFSIELDKNGKEDKIINEKGIIDSNGKTIPFNYDFKTEVIDDQFDNGFVISANRVDIGDGKAVGNIVLAQATISKDANNEVKSVTIEMPDLQYQDYEVSGSGISYGLAKLFIGESGIKERVEKSATSSLLGSQEVVSNAVKSLDFITPTMRDKLVSDLPEVYSKLSENAVSNNIQSDRLKSAVMTITSDKLELNINTIDDSGVEKETKASKDITPRGISYGKRIIDNTREQLYSLGKRYYDLGSQSYETVLAKLDSAEQSFSEIVKVYNSVNPPAGSGSSQGSVNGNINTYGPSGTPPFEPVTIVPSLDASSQVQDSTSQKQSGASEINVLTSSQSANQNPEPVKLKKVGGGIQLSDDKYHDALLSTSFRLNTNQVNGFVDLTKPENPDENKQSLNNHVAFNQPVIVSVDNPRLTKDNKFVADFYVKQNGALILKNTASMTLSEFRTLSSLISHR